MQIPSAVSERLAGWVFCNPAAALQRDWTIQANDDTLVSFTESGRMIIARCKVGDVGQQWHDGELKMDASEEAYPIGYGYAYMGSEGSTRFATEIGATKTCPPDRFEACPTLPHHQFADQGTAQLFPGLVQAAHRALETWNWRAASTLVAAMENIAAFARSPEAWNYVDLPKGTGDA